MIMTKEEYASLEFDDLLLAMGVYNKENGDKFFYNRDLELLKIGSGLLIPGFNERSFKNLSLREHLMTVSEYKQETIKGNTSSTFINGKFIF